MSLAELADAEILRTDRRTLDLTSVIEPHVPYFMSITNLDPARANDLRMGLKPVAAASPIQRTPSAGALDALAKYIPTESVTLYVAAMAAISSLTTTFPWLTPYVLYWGFVGLTPVLFLLIYIGKRRSQGLTALPQSVAQWPWWKLIASTIAFTIWALAVPPLVATDAGKIVAAFGALLVSTLLSLIGAVVEPQEASR